MRSHSAPSTCTVREMTTSGRLPRFSTRPESQLPSASSTDGGGACARTGAAAAASRANGPNRRRAGAERTNDMGAPELGVLRGPSPRIRHPSAGWTAPQAPEFPDARFFVGPARCHPERTMASPSVRPARESDLDLLVAFNLAMARETEDHGLDERVLREGV